MYRYFYLLQDKLTKLRYQPFFWFLVLFLISGFVSLVALRQNNATMIKLRDDVYAADKNAGNVEGALDTLRTYVYGHMNTNLSTGTNIKPPIQLKYTYQRLQAQAQAQSDNSQLYIDAKNYCEQQVPASVSISGRGRISCVEDYVLSHGGSPAPAVPVGLYEFDFASPSWSPDFAGWSLVATALFLLASLVGLILDKLGYLRFSTE